MIPKKFSESKKQNIINPISNSIFLQDTTPMVDNKCIVCKFDFVPKKNKIMYNKFVIKYKDNESYQYICSKCLSNVDENTIQECITYEEFSKRNPL